MCINPRSRLALLKLEATPGVAETPAVGTDDWYVMNDSGGIKTNAAVLDDEWSTPDGFDLASTLGSIKPTATYRWVPYMLGKTGGVVNLPLWLSSVLGSCGHVNQYLGGPTYGSIVEWTPDAIYSRLTDTANSTSAVARTFTIYDYIGREGSDASGSKILHAIKGAMVSKLRIILTTGQLVAIEADFVGQYIRPSLQTTDLSGYNLVATSNFYTPINTGQQFTFANSDTYAMKPSSTTIEIDFGAKHVEGDTPGGFGVACIERSQQAKVTMTTNPIVTTTRFDQMMAAGELQETLAYAMTGSLTPQGITADTGYTIKASASGVQFTSEMERGDVLRHSVTAKLKSNDGSTPPFKLTFS